MISSCLERPHLNQGAKRDGAVIAPSARPPWRPWRCGPPRSSPCCMQPGQLVSAVVQMASGPLHSPCTQYLGAASVAAEQMQSAKFLGVLAGNVLAGCRGKLEGRALAAPDVLGLGLEVLLLQLDLPLALQHLLVYVLDRHHRHRGRRRNLRQSSARNCCLRRAMWRWPLLHLM